MITIQNKTQRDHVFGIQRRPFRHKLNRNLIQLFYIPVSKNDDSFVLTCMGRTLDECMNKIYNQNRFRVLETA